MQQYPHLPTCLPPNPSPNPGLRWGYASHLPQPLRLLPIIEANHHDNPKVKDVKAAVGGNARGGSRSPRLRPRCARHSHVHAIVVPAASSAGGQPSYVEKQRPLSHASARFKCRPEHCAPRYKKLSSNSKKVKRPS
jgi:hypothetical protein